jgi:hypothetical protein
MDPKNNYGFFDRFLHQFVFSTPLLQKILCELENDLFKKKLDKVKFGNELFITGLPRAGTTLLLNLLYATGEFSSFTYRSMPFILTPLLWHRFSHSFQHQGTAKERAHGDGVLVSWDSPEAFEEVIWLAHYKKQIVHADRLVPITQDDLTGEFTNCMEQSIKKCLLIDIETGLTMSPRRYLSKNNSNMARIEILTQHFPGSTVLVMFRNPLAHISSLMKQHERFVKHHREDGFARKYMEFLGHYEFGESFKPVNFNHWLDREKGPYEVNSDFWLQYWIEAYSHVLSLETDERVVFLDFDTLMNDAEHSLQTVADAIHIEKKKTLISGSAAIRVPTTQPLKATYCSDKWLEEADSVYKDLTARAINKR